MTNTNWNASDYAVNSSAQQKWADELAAKLDIAADDHILDIGCGDGKITVGLAGRAPEGKTVGIDSSESMIAYAREHRTAPNVTYKVMDARKILLPDKFSIIFSNAALHWVDDHPAVLRGIKQHLTTKGKALLQMGGKGNTREIRAAIDEVRLGPSYAKYFKDFGYPYNFFDIPDYEKWLKSAGLRANRLELIPRDMKHDGPEGLKGWLRTTKFPYLDMLPDSGLREQFLNDVLETYLSVRPLDEEGRTTVKMVRLEVEAGHL